MNRRQFLGTLIGSLAAAAAVRTFPFRVYSFPTEIVQPSPEAIAYIDNKMMAAVTDLIEPDTFDQISAATLAALRDDIIYDNFFADTPFLTYLRSHQPLEIESRVIRVPLNVQ